MTQGPPCANCGTLLRWFPDQQQWGCASCRVMYPAQALAAAAAIPAQRSRRRVLGIAAAGVVLAAGGGIAATIALHDTPHVDLGTGSGSAGSGSASAVKPRPP